jgi:hypothetical protein
MPKYLECVHCGAPGNRPIAMAPDDSDPTCPTCGNERRIVPAEHARAGMDSGSIFNIDLRTGGRAKPPRRR